MTSPAQISFSLPRAWASPRATNFSRNTTFTIFLVFAIALLLVVNGFVAFLRW
jgi:hypothetical protein